MKIIRVKKGQIIQQSGALNTKVYKVEKGLLRSYTIDRKGKEHIYMFASEDWIIGDVCKITVPCELFIDAIENATIVEYEKEINMIDPPLNALFNRLAVLQKRIIMLMSYSAAERYTHFTESYPDIIQRVPQKMIASYLGITPEALSRVRRELSIRKFE